MNKNGFTMIELIVAIAIMGVIMIIAVPSVNYIQNNNRDTKFRTYEKAITSSSKLYTDQYVEDLFGSKNTGCAVIRYEDLKDRDLIEDIQIKDTICDNSKIKSDDYKNYTYVLVRKSKNGNFNYETNTSCRSTNDELLYGTPNNENLEEKCKHEDGKGPEIYIRDTSGLGPPTYKAYYYDDVLNIKATISDSGVGLMEGQTLDYQWFKNGSPVGNKTTINFNNKNYEGSKTKPIKTPGDISKPTKTTTYRLHVEGTVVDIDGNATPLGNGKGIDIDFTYFVGTAFISLHANGGSMASSHYSGLSIKSDGYVYNGDNKYVQTVRYKQALGTDGLWNYNNSSWLNLVRTGYHIDNTKEWKSSNGVHSIYDDDKKDYKDTDFCTNLRTNNCYVDLYANWIINTYTLTYDNKGGSGCSTQTRNHGDKWGPLCTPSRAGYRFTGWSGVKADDIATKNVTATANWTVLEPYYNQNGTYFPTLQQAIDGTGNGGTIYLSKDYNDKEKATLNKNKKIRFNANGHTLNLTKEHIVVTNGTFYVTNGTINTMTKNMSAIFADGGTLDLESGITVSNTYITNEELDTQAIKLKSGKVIMRKGSTVNSGVGDKSGYARSVLIKGGTFEMQNGSRINANATKKSGYGATGINNQGGTVKIRKGATIYVTKGGKARAVIANNSGKSYVYNGAKLTITGEVNNGKAPAALYVRNGSICYEEGVSITWKDGAKEKAHKDKDSGTGKIIKKDNGKC